MEAHEMSVGGEVEIGLEMVGSGLQARTEGEHGVLRPQDAAAPMGDDLAVAPGMGKRHGPSLRKIASYGCRHPNEKEGPERIPAPLCLPTDSLDDAVFQALGS